MGDEKNIHELFEEIQKDTPPQNRYKRKPKKSDGTYQTFGMIYGALYGLLAGYFAGILLDRMSVSIVAGLVIGLLVGRTIGYSFKKKGYQSKQETKDKMENPEEVEDKERKL